MQQRTMEQIADDVPMLTLLDSSVLQMVDQLVAVLARYDMPLADQVIEVPKVSCPARCGRTVLCTPQTVEQLVEVPTILTPSFLRMLQNVDIPVPHGGRGASGGLQGFLPGHSSLKRTANKIADLPAPRSGVRRLQGFFPEQSSTTTSFSSLERISERNVEQIVDSRGFGGGLQDLRPGLSSSSSSHDPARVSEALDEPGEGFFRTFHQILKKCDTNSALGVGTASALEPMDAGCL